MNLLKDIYLRFVVRFSDHFSKDNSKVGAIEIIKISGFYTIRLISLGVSYTLDENSVLPYLKSILLIYPELINTVTGLRAASNKAISDTSKMYNKLLTAEKQLNFKDEYIEMVDAIYEENKKLKTDNTNLNNKITVLKTKIEEFKKELANAKNTLNRIKNIATIN